MSVPEFIQRWPESSGQLRIRKEGRSRDFEGSVSALPRDFCVTKSVVASVDQVYQPYLRRGQCNRSGRSCRQRRAGGDWKQEVPRSNRTFECCWPLMDGQSLLLSIGKRPGGRTKVGFGDCVVLADIHRLVQATTWLSLHPERYVRVHCA